MAFFAPLIALRRLFPTPWHLLMLAMTGFVMIPLGVVCSSLFSTWSVDIWRHLANHLLVSLLINTFFLTAGVMAGTAVLGISLAALVVLCEFPGRKFFDWALVLPLAIPSYVLAFVMITLFDFSGPLQTVLREWGGVTGFPAVRSRGGLIGVFSLTLFPYVYLLSRNAFLTQGGRAIEVAQSLGVSRLSAFFRLSLPMALPWVVAALLLVVMEVMADFGTVSIFNYDTFTTAIYKAWFGFFSISTAAQLAALLLINTLALFFFAQRWIGGGRFLPVGRNERDAARIVLKGRVKGAAFFYCSAVLFLSFLLPITPLLIWAARNFTADFDARYFSFLCNSLWLGGMSALVVVTVALAIAYAERLRPNLLTRTCSKIVSLGYALPGSVLAVGLFIPLSWWDLHVQGGIARLFGLDLTMALRSSVGALLFAYVIRFFASGFGSVSSAMHCLSPRLDESAQTLGVGGFGMLRRVHLPLLRGGLATAAVLVFVEVMKEMPMTLMMRPFGWDTLAVRIFEMTAEGEWQRAALPSVTLVLIGLLPIFLLVRHSRLR